MTPPPRDSGHLRDSRHPGDARNPWVTLGLVAALCLMVGLSVGMWAEKRIAASGPAAAPPPTLTADEVEFARTLLLAHRDAVLVTRLLPDDAAPDVRRAADEVMASQWRTAGPLTGWLEAGGITDPLPLPEFGHHGHGPAPAPDAAGPAPATAPAVPAGPTVVTQADLDRLAGLDGPAAEVAYLQVMIGHQERTAVLLAEAADGLTTPAVQRAAAVMTDDRVEAVDLMARTLADRGVQAGPRG